MCAQVVMAGSQSSSFPVEVGVKQDCVLAPIIFKLLLVAITLVSHRGLQISDCVGIEYRLDCGLFNLRRLQSKTKTSSTIISVLLYADDAAFPALLLTDFSVVLMSCLTSVQALYSIQQKHKSLFHHHLMPQLFVLVGISFKILKILLTFW